MVFDTGDNPTHVHVGQRRSGEVIARIDAARDSEAALHHLRFILAVDDDTSPFAAAVAGDALLGTRVATARGVRPLRTATVSHAVLQAFAGQLITAREAKLIERRALTRIGRTHRGLMLPPRQDDLRSLTVADWVACGLSPKRASALGRLVRHVDLEALRNESADGLRGRLLRERMVGPWSAGVVALHGAGRYDIGLVGDLNLIRLSANLLDRPATEADSAELLGRYDPWAGLASSHLMAHPLARERRHRRADGRPPRATPDGRMRTARG